MVAYAGDLTCVRKLETLNNWLDILYSTGPKFDYRPQPTNSWLIVKEKSIANATHILKESNINIISTADILLL